VCYDTNVSLLGWTQGQMLCNVLLEPTICGALATQKSRNTTHFNRCQRPGEYRNYVVSQASSLLTTTITTDSLHTVHTVDCISL
jgi:hypothetical protein